MKKIYLLLLVCFVPGDARADELDWLDRQMSSAPLTAISFAFAHLGIERADLVAATRAIEPRPRFLVAPSFGSISEADRETPPALPVPSWQSYERAVHEQLSLNLSQRKKHRAIVFQTLVAKGWLPHAMRYVGAGATAKVEKEWLASVDKVEDELESKLAADQLSIWVEVIDEALGSPRLRTAIGEPFAFMNSIVDPHASALSTQAPCLQPFRLLRSFPIQKELKLSVDQLKKCVQTERAWLKKVEMIEVESFFTNEIDYELVGNVKGSIDETNDAILTSARNLLNEEQLRRFNELLLRTYIHSERFDLVERILDFDVDGKKLTRETHTEIRAAKHLRCIQTYLPLVLSAMTKHQKRQHLSYRFIPHSIYGKRAKLTAKLFSEFGDDFLPDRTNPRR